MSPALRNDVRIAAQLFSGLYAPVANHFEFTLAPDISTRCGEGDFLTDRVCADEYPSHR
jgi:hypothetical protein